MCLSACGKFVSLLHVFLEVVWDETIPWNRVTCIMHARRTLQPLLINCAPLLRRLMALKKEVLNDEDAFRGNVLLHEEEKSRICRLAYQLMSWERIMMSTGLVNKEMELQRKLLEVAKTISYRDAAELMKMFRYAKKVHRILNDVKKPRSFEATELKLEPLRIPEYWGIRV